MTALLDRVPEVVLASNLSYRISIMKLVIDTFPFSTIGAIVLGNADIKERQGGLTIQLSLPHRWAPMQLPSQCEYDS